MDQTFSKSRYLQSLLCIWFIIPGFYITGIVSAQNAASFTAFRDGSEIVIDGILDEEAWMQVEPVTGFIQFEPNSGTPSVRHTEVRVIFGDDDLYIGAFMADDPGNVESTLGRRDEYNHADWFIISVDSQFNRRTAYVFGVNAGGVQMDGQLNKSLAADGNLLSGVDLSWNAIWYSSARKTAEGWIAEIRIPYSMLRFSNLENQTWGIHFTRRIARLGEVSEWPHLPVSQRSNMVANFGQITNIRKVDPKKEFQIRPYILSRLDTYENSFLPGKTEYGKNFDTGLDIKLGLGSNIMLDATIKPDFGQVESDPAVLNLTAFETQLLENRPFFLEGASIYKFGIGQSQLFHSRRIGAKDNITGAAKVSGRTAGGLSFGLLGAGTGHNFNSSGNYGVGRVSQQFGQYSSAGAILTAYSSPVLAGEGWRSMTGGVDLDLRMPDNKYGFEGIAAFARRNSLIPDRSDENGFMAGIVFRKRQGSLTGHITSLVFSDQYNPNDLGWTTNERDFRNIWSNLTYNINGGKPFGPFQRASLRTYHTQRVSYRQWLNIGDINSVTAEFVTRNFRTIKLSSRFSDIFGGYDLFETRGLGHWARPSSVYLTGQFITDERRNWKIGQEGTYLTYSNGGRKYGLELEGRLDLGTKFSFSGSTHLNAENGVLAWMSNESFLHTDGSWSIGLISANPGLLGPDDFVRFDDRGILETVLSAVEPFGPDIFYVPVFGERDTRSVNFTFRSALTLTNNLSMQVYNQLLLAKGKFENFQIMQDPDRLASFDAYPKQRDFSLSSLQVNMVMRWEYRAGSTIYLIWTQGRRERDEMNPLAQYQGSPYDRKFGNQITNAFNVFPRNAFMLKVNYTFLN
jgi:hypothetical protein